MSDSLFEWEHLSPLRCVCCPDGAGRIMCQEWTLHRDRRRRYGPVHLIPGRKRNGAKLFTAVYFNLSICWSQFRGLCKIQQNQVNNMKKTKTTQFFFVRSVRTTLHNLFSISIFCQAKLIEFQPLRATDVKLPGGAVFVISNCCREMNKAASSHYNIRVVECRIATKVRRLCLVGPLPSLFKNAFCTFTRSLVQLRQFLPTFFIWAPLKCL